MIVLVGNGTIAARGLKILLELGIQVPLVITDGPDGGEDTWRLSLLKAARELGYADGVNLLSVKNPNQESVLGRIRECRPDLILSLQPKSILRKSLIEIPSAGVVNLHNAPLPLLRGCDPFAWAIHDGLQQMGVSLHMVPDEGIDSGPVIAQRFWDIHEDTTAWDLYRRSIGEGELLLRENIHSILRREFEPREQDPRLVTYHSMNQFNYGDMQISWNSVYTTLSSWIRSRIFPPFQTPYFTMEGTKLYVLKCRARKAPTQIGRLMQMDDESMSIGAKWGRIVIESVATEKPDHLTEGISPSNLIAALAS